MKRINHPTRTATWGVAALTLAACATGPVKDPAAEHARAELTRLQAEPQLAKRAPVAISDADAAVSAAEGAKDEATAAQLGYIAEKKVEIARALAERQLAEDESKMTSAERDRIRLQARTNEADAATADANASRVQTAIALQQADAANQAANQAQLEAADMKQQMLDLNAKMTDRGMVLTLGDVLFSTNRADLKSGAAASLGKLTTFLNKYPDRTVTIEGYTDSTGSDDLNLALSQHRAEAVKSYLVSQGIDSGRISATGMGKTLPVASNANAAGRQQNRRVEIIIGKTSVVGATN